MTFGDADMALLKLLEHLTLFGYRFVTPTPETHRRVWNRGSKAVGRDLRDIFGWNLPFSASALPHRLWQQLEIADMIGDLGEGLCRSLVRVSTVEGRLFLHSAYPTVERDAVFLGPDSYRFARFLKIEIQPDPGIRHLVDIGAGAGVGAIVMAPRVPNARLTLIDTNPLALRLATINARHAGVEIETIEGSGIDRLTTAFDLAIANPPFLADPGQRSYRHGGGAHGGALSLEWALAAARRVDPGGRVLLYSGSAIVDGVDRLEADLAARLPALGCAMRYEEIDPDIFGEELDGASYRDVERIAAIGAVIAKA